MGQTFDSSLSPESQSAVIRRVRSEAQTISETVGSAAIAVAAKGMLAKIDEGIVRY